MDKRLWEIQFLNPFLLRLVMQIEVGQLLPVVKRVYVSYVTAAHFQKSGFRET
jgi:hypothetical protein